jgi:hypothetical protein
MYLMKKHLNLIGAAVTASLGAGAAFALPPNTAFNATLTISGSSAFEAAIESELGSSTSSICATGTYNIFKSHVSDFRAYTCTAKAAVVTPTSAGGEAIAIYYRGEGGSVVGLAPVVRNITLYRLDLSNCPTAVTPGSTAIVNCTIGTYNSVQDTGVATSGLQAAQTQLGFSDEEPAMFVGENYPAASVFSWLQPSLTTGEIAALSGAQVLKTLIAQSFSVYVTNYTTTGSTAEHQALAGLGGLSRNTLSNIFRGSYADWSQVPVSPGQNNSGFVIDPNSGNLPIKLCRREQGSGTQTAASIFFNDYVLSGQSFASSGAALNLDEVNAGAGGVKENLSTGALQSCLQDGTHAASGALLPVGAIGYFSSGADLASSGSTAGYKHLLIDGQGDTAANQANLSTLVAKGDYDYWYELVSLKRPGIPTTASNIAEKLISVTQKQASGPTSAYVTFLPSYNTALYPPAVVAGKKPIGCLTRLGKSTNKATWQCL